MAGTLRWDEWSEAPRFGKAMEMADTLIGEFLGSEMGLDWIAENFTRANGRPLPAGPLFSNVALVDADTLFGNQAAYIDETDTVLFSRAFLEEASDGRMIDVILEEYGHRLDALLGGDTPGDEGAAFAAAVRGEPTIMADYQGSVGRVTIDGIAYDAEFATSVSDSGGFEGSSQTLTLDSNGGGTLTYRYEHYSIPDRFIIRYEGQTLLDTGFTGGRRSGTIDIPEGDSNEIEIRVATNNAGTAWNYDVTADVCPQPEPFVVTSLGDEFELVNGKCEADATVTVGRTDGTNPLLRAENGSASFDARSIALDSATFFASIGGVSESLWVGSTTIDVSSRKGSITEDSSGTFQLAGLDTDFKEVTILSNKLAFDVLFRLPDEATGLIVDTVNIFDDALIIDSNGPRFALGGRIELPDVVDFRLLNVVDVEGSDLALEYRAGEDALRLQGKITFDKFAKTVGGISKIEADLSGSNYVQINSDTDVDLVGKLKVSRELEAPRGWGLSNIELTIDTTSNEIGGSATIRTPFGVKFGEGATAKPTLEFFTDPLQLDALGLEIDNLNKPIPAYPLFFFQRIAGQVDNFAPDNPKDIEFSGGIGATLGPQIGGTRLARLDLDGKITPEKIEGTGNLDILTAEFNAFGRDLGTFTLVKGTGTSTLDWSKGEFSQSGSFNFVDGLVTTSTTLTMDTDFNFSTGGSAAVGLPDFVPVFGGASLTNANYAVRFTNDGTLANDYVAGWGQITIEKLGFTVDVTAGLRANFDGTFDRIGAGNIPPVGSWAIEGDEEYVLFSARWDNADPAAKLLVELPDGTILTEADFAANDIAVLDEFSSDTQRTVIAFNPGAGIWDIEVADPTGLGTVITEALTETEGPTFSYAADALTVNGNEVAINYAAFDGDSTADISFYYDDDPSVVDGLFIGSTTEMDGTGSFLWDISTVAPGEYYVYAMTDDRNNPILIEYTDETVTVSGTEADLGITLTPSATEIGSGDSLIYTVDVANFSAVTAQNTRVLVTLPDGATLAGSSIAPTSQTGQELTFDLGEVAANGTTQFTVNVNGPVVSDATTLSADALVLADNVDPNPANDADFVDILATADAAPTVDLAVTATNIPTDIDVGKRFSYTVTVTNDGPSDATNVVLDEFIDNANAVSVSGGFALSATNFRINIGTLAAGASRDVAISGTALAAGSLLSSSRVGSSEAELTPGNNEDVRTFTVDATAPEPADLSLALSGTEPDELGRASITVTLTNSGPGIGSNIEVFLDLPDGVVVTGSSAIQGTYDPATSVWSLGNVRDNLSRNLTLQLDGSAATTGEVIAEVVAVDEVDPDSTPDNRDPAEDDYAALTLAFGPADPVRLVGTPDADSLDGNTGDDTLIGLSGDDTLNGSGGNDQLIGNDGDDIINAGAGGDTAIGNNGNDTIDGGEGDDSLVGNNGDDALFGGDGDDTLIANNGDDVLHGGNGNDSLVGNNGDDVLFGGEGNDTLNGDNGEDTMAGGAGDDVIFAGNGETEVAGGAGNDLIYLSNGADQLILAEVAGSADADMVYSFNSDEDTIVLSSALTGLPAGALDPSAFALGTDAVDADDRVIYDQPSGELRFDADGDGPASAELLATFVGWVPLDPSDFNII